MEITQKEDLRTEYAHEFIRLSHEADKLNENAYWIINELFDWLLSKVAEMQPKAVEVSEGDIAREERNWHEIKYEQCASIKGAK